MERRCHSVGIGGALCDCNRLSPAAGCKQFTFVLYSIVGRNVLIWRTYNRQAASPGLLWSISCNITCMLRSVYQSRLRPRWSSTGTLRYLTSSTRPIRILWTVWVVSYPTDWNYMVQNRTRSLRVFCISTEKKYPNRLFGDLRPPRTMNDNK